MTDVEQRARELLAERGRFPSGGAVPFDVAVPTIAAALRSEDGGWQPIETAPDDGPDIWVFGGKYNVPTIVEPDGGHWRWSKAEGYRFVPTHWMPVVVPTPPVLPTTPKPMREMGEGE